MKKSKISINVEGGFLFCGGWNFSKSVSVGSTFIREMRVLWLDYLLQTVYIIHDTILEQSPYCIHKVQKILDLFGWVPLFSHQE